MKQHCKHINEVTCSKITVKNMRIGIVNYSPKINIKLHDNEKNHVGVEVLITWYVWNLSNCTWPSAYVDISMRDVISLSELFSSINFIIDSMIR